MPKYKIKIDRDALQDIQEQPIGTMNKPLA